ncbi:MAG: PmeII family type II restriction endonuclease [Gaiellaceae bacterium]
MRATIADRVRAILGVDLVKAREITDAFDRFVARPLATNLAKLRGHHLARRNPMIYTARGVRTVNEWIDRVVEDKETSAIEAHLGTWLEEVAHIVSGGIKPGSGVDLQLTRADGSIVLYAIQSAPNTKNAGSRAADLDALKRAARPLRAHRKVVDLRVAVLWGRAATTESESEPGIEIQGSDDFWDNISGIMGFRARLLDSTVALSELLGGRSAEEVARLRQEAREFFGTASGDLDLNALANPPRPPRRRRITELTESD